MGSSPFIRTKKTIDFGRWFFLFVAFSSQLGWYQYKEYDIIQYKVAFIKRRN